MSKTYIPKSVQEKIRLEAQERCGYCHTQSAVIGMPLTIEHIVPESRGGTSDEENLWLSCRRCNEFKGAKISAEDPITKQTVLLFNPRLQKWEAHFVWRENGLIMEGITPIGRATIIALQLNNLYLIRSRKRWIAVGWHPPQ